MTIYQPYFYIIFFPEINKRYAGIRFAKKCHPSELMVKYKTSSKVVHQLLAQGHVVVIEQITPFSDIEQLRDYEVDFLRPKTTDDHWLNKGAGKAIHNDEETRKLIGSYFKGRVLTAEHRAAISRGGKGLIRSPETRARIGAAKRGIPNPEAAERMRGNIWSETTRQKISKTKTGRPLTDAEKDGRRRAGETNRGRETSDETREKNRQTALIQWARVREQKYEELDISAITTDFKNGMLKMDIYKKYNISRHCFKQYISPHL